VRGDEPEGDGKVRLTSARWPEQDDLLSTLDEAERGELLDLRPRGGSGEPEVVRLERLLCSGRALSLSSAANTLIRSCCSVLRAAPPRTARRRH
jgi:hypothetical protein